MSVIYCHDCHQAIDTDFNEEHFDSEERCYAHRYKDCALCEGGGRIRDQYGFTDCHDCAGNGCILKEVP